MGQNLGDYTGEEAAARAYIIAAERVGRPLNVITPAGAAGAGAGPKRAPPTAPAARATDKTMKRAAPTTKATHAPSKKMKHYTTSSGAADTSGVTAAHWAKLDVQVKLFKANSFCGAAGQTDG
jgi:hypothetical protein